MKVVMFLLGGLALTGVLFWLLISSRSSRPETANLNDARTALTTMELEYRAGKPIEAYRYGVMPGMDEALVEKAESAKTFVTEQLRDPASAQWGDIWTVNLVHICGTLNAKNGLGGYAGAKRFVHGAGEGGLEGTPGWSEALWSQCVGDRRVISSAP